MAALLSVFSSGIGMCQQPVAEKDAPAPAAATVSPPSDTAGARARELDEVRAEMTRLQKRLDQIAPPGKIKPAVDAPSPVAPMLEGLIPSPGGSLPTILDATSAPEKPEEDSGLKMKARWRDGLEIQSLDNMFRVHVGGFLALDYGWNGASHAVQFAPGGTGELADGADFRYARIRIDGTAYQHVEWVAEFDFSNSVNNDTATSTAPIGSPSFSNVWIGYNDIPYVGTLRAGWQDEPISLQHPQSARYLSFYGAAAWLRHPVAHVARHRTSQPQRGRAPYLGLWILPRAE
jgi:hypothetical protein